MAKVNRNAFRGNTMPAGMEGDSDGSDDFIDFLKTNQTNDNGGGTKRNVHNSTKNGASSNAQSQNGDRQPRTLFNDDETSPQENPNHWRKSRMHQSLPMPMDEFRMAIMQGNFGMVKSLVEQGFPVDEIMTAGWTGLMYSCSCAHPEITRYLLEHKANVHYHKERFDSLIAACANSSIDDEARVLQCVEILVEYGCDVNVMEKHHVTPLIFAAREGRSTVVTFLLEKGANVDVCDNGGWTALAWAIKRGHGAVVRILLEAKASVSIIKSSGLTLVELAKDSGQDQIAHLLEIFGDTKAVNDMHLTNQPVSRLSEPAPFTEKQRFKNMKCGDLELFLTGLNLSHLIPVFHQNDLSFQQFLRLTDDDLTTIGIEQLGARKLILEGIRDVHRMDWEESSLQKLDQLAISCPEAVSMVENISKHLCYIHSSIGYLRDQIQAKPRILELGQEAQSVRTLLEVLEGAIKNNKNLQEEMRFFKLHLDKVQDNVDYIPADMIVERRASDSDVEFRRKRRHSVWSFGAVAALVGVVMISTGAWRRPSVVITKMISWRL